MAKCFIFCLPASQVNSVIYTGLSNIKIKYVSVADVGDEGGIRRFVS